jgi:DNA alkylation repair enzyme
MLASRGRATPSGRSGAGVRTIGGRVIEQGADDGRNYVKKAVNWALRQIGKRNAALHEPALHAAMQLRARPSRAARWIGADAWRELDGPAVRSRLRL